MIHKATFAAVGLSLYVSFILLISCDSKMHETRTGEPIIRVEKISVNQIPTLDLNRTYFLVSSAAPVPETLLKAMWRSGLPVSQAWLPLNDRCDDPIGARFTVELKVPDSRILQFGFAQGEGRLACASQLYHYTISE